LTIVLGYIGIIGIIRLFLFNKKYNNLFIIIAVSLLFFIAATRTIEFGSDVIRYVNIYERLADINLTSIINDFFNGSRPDPLFYIFSKFVSIIGSSYRIWLALLSGIFIFSVARIIKKYSPYPLFSFISLISLGYFYFSLTGLRQTIALSAILFSYPFLRERKLVPFIATVLIASLFHSSALIFLISYPIVYIKIGFKHAIGIISALIASIFFGNYIRVLVDLIGWTENLSAYASQETSLSYTGFIIQLFIFLFCIYFYKNVLKNDYENLSLYNLLVLGLMFQVFASTIAEFFRISMYFSIFSIILIPKAISTIKNKNMRLLIYYLIILILIAYIFWTGDFDGFQFFWNDSISHIN